MNNTVIEVCGNCETETELVWDVKTEGYSAYCPHCGDRMMLCDECLHSNECKNECFSMKLSDEYGKEIKICYRAAMDQIKAGFRKQGHEIELKIIK